MIEIKVPDEPQGDYISRQAVYELIGTLKMGDVRAMEKLRRGLEKLPSEERVGKWTKKINADGRWDRVRYYCSACGGWNTYGQSRFCPNCGARMEREDEDSN